MKKQNWKHQNAKSIGEKLKTKGLLLFVSFFLWFARFQILICEPQSFLYWVDFTITSLKINREIIQLRLHKTFGPNCAARCSKLKG